MVLAPRRQMGHEATVGVGGIDTDVSAYFFEVDGVDAIDRLLNLVQPAFEPQKTHAATFKSARLKVFGAAGDRAVRVVQCPTGVGAQIKGE